MQLRYYRGYCLPAQQMGAIISALTKNIPMFTLFVGGGHLLIEQVYIILYLIMILDVPLMLKSIYTAGTSNLVQSYCSYPRRRKGYTLTMKLKLILFLMNVISGQLVSVLVKVILLLLLLRS